MSSGSIFLYENNNSMKGLAMSGGFRMMYYSQLWMQPKSGKVIILNGPSAAGKSSLQRSIQRLASVPYLSVGIDDLLKPTENPVAF